MSPRPARRALAASLTGALALCGVLLGAAPAFAGTTTFSGALEPGDSTRLGSYGCMPYAGATVGEYDTQAFTVSEDGLYDIAMTAMSSGDLAFLLFDGPYVADAPHEGCIAYNDDRGSLRPGLATELEAGVTYTLLTEHLVGSGAGSTVQYTNVISGPGEVTLVGSPTVTIEQGADQADPAAAIPVTFDVRFSEPVTGFEATDVTVSGTAGGGAVTVAGEGADYVVTVGSVEQDGTITAAIPANAATAVATGLPSTMATSTDATVSVATAPTVTVAQAEGQADPTETLPIEFEVQFSDFVTGLAPEDVLLTGTAGATTVELVALDSPPVETEEPSPSPSVPPTISPSPSPSSPPVSSTDSLDEPAAEGEPLPSPEAYASRYLVRVLDAAQGGTVEVAIAAGAATTAAGGTSLASTADDASVTYVVAVPSPAPSVSPSASAAVPTAPAPTSSEPAVSAGEDSLPQTGASPLWFALALATALVAAGIGARRLARKG